MTPRNPRRLILLTLIGTVAAMAGLASCGSSGQDSAVEPAWADGAVSADDTGKMGGIDEAAMVEMAAEDAGFEVEAFEESESDAAGEHGGVATTGSASPPVAQFRTNLGRDIIYTAHLQLGSTDVAVATREAITAVESVGGFLFSQETSGGSAPSSVLVFKVLPEHFQTALNKLGSVSWVRGQSVSADDVTAVVVDLESRITTAESSVERLRKLLDDSDNIERIALLEAQLMERETSLERLRGQLRAVRNQVDLATITVSITRLASHPAIEFTAFIYDGHDDGFSCFDRLSARRFEPESPATICYRVTNIGDSTLVDLELEDPAFGATVADLRIVDGHADRLEPGQSLIMAHEVVVDEAARLRTLLVGRPIDPDGNPLADEVRFPSGMIRIDLVEDDSSLPGMGETLRSSWDALETIIMALVLAVVATIPFLPFVVAAWFAWRWFRSRKAAKPDVTPPPAPVLDPTEAAAEEPATTA